MACTVSTDTYLSHSQTQQTHPPLHQLVCQQNAIITPIVDSSSTVDVCSDKPTTICLPSFTAAIITAASLHSEKSSVLNENVCSTWVRYIQFFCAEINSLSTKTKKVCIN